MSHSALIELLRGKGAHVDPLACVEDLAAEIAHRRVSGFPHSIAGLVFHMNYWMKYELQRIRGQRSNYPEHNAGSFPAASSDLDWDALRNEFAVLLQEFGTLAGSPESEMQRQIESVHEGDKKVSGTLESVITQIIAHNSYHTGQIAMMRRMMDAWPPRDGGDTW